MNAPRRHLPLSPRPGFTLVEVLLAMSVSAMLLLGLTSVMLVAGNASNAAARQTNGELRAFFDQLREDAAAATAIQVSNSTSMTLTVPDRTGDGVADQISYDWSNGNASGVITRSFNNVARTSSIGATAFALTPTIDSTTSSTPTTSAETLLFQHATLLLLTNYSIKSNQSCGMQFTASLPSGATSWRITRVRIPLRYKGPTLGSTRVQVRTSANGLPGLVLEETSLQEASLPAAFTTTEFAFTAQTTQAASSPTACVTLVWQKDADAAELQYESILSVLSGAQWVASTDGSVTWTASSLRSIALEVYGTYTMPANTTTRRVSLLTIDVKPREPALQTAIHTVIRLPNTPLVSP